MSGPPLPHRLLRPGAVRTAALGALLIAVLIALAIAFPRQQTRRPLPAVASEPAAVKVSLTGAVRQPGVYTLRDSDRVADALAAAGGVLPEADLSGISLTARLRDAQQIAVPRQGQAAPAPAVTATVAPLTGLIDLNTATKAQLLALPGIGEVRAQRILESRANDGPFRTSSDLVARKLVPAAIFERLKDRLTVS